jgi:hypothetical protein
MAEPTPFRPRVLTLHALDHAKTWEAALSLPLPDNPGFDLLQRTRDEVLSYLVWVFNDVSAGLVGPGAGAGSPSKWSSP